MLYVAKLKVAAAIVAAATVVTGGGVAVYQVTADDGKNAAGGAGATANDEKPKPDGPVEKIPLEPRTNTLRPKWHYRGDTGSRGPRKYDVTVVSNGQQFQHWNNKAKVFKKLPSVDFATREILIIWGWEASSGNKVTAKDPVVENDQLVLEVIRDQMGKVDAVGYPLFVLECARTDHHVLLKVNTITYQFVRRPKAKSPTTKSTRIKE